MKAIVTKYSGCTDTRGSRIIASDSDGNRVLYDHSLSTREDDAHHEAVRALCKKKGWSGVLVEGEIKRRRVFVWIKGPVTLGDLRNITNVVVI